MYNNDFLLKDSLWKLAYLSDEDQPVEEDDSTKTDKPRTDSPIAELKKNYH
jgi:hypothetical protein